MLALFQKVTDVYAVAAIASVNAAQGFCFVDMRINAPHPATMHIEYGSWASQDVSAQDDHIVDISKGYKKYFVELYMYINDNRYVPPIWMTYFASSAPYISCTNKNKVFTVNHGDTRCYTSLSACGSSNMFPLVNIECKYMLISNH